MDKETKSFVFKKKLFGGEVEIVIFGEDEKKIGQAVDLAYKEALRLQKIFNFYDDESELSRLNLERKIDASQELLEVVTKAEVMKELTKGNYDVTLGKTIKERKAGKAVKNLECGELEVEGGTITLKKEGVLIDLGSIAKGFITDRFGEDLKTKGCGDFMIDSRGDILFSGRRKYVIKVQHPRKKEDFLCKIGLMNEGVATSGDYNQFYGNYENSHIVNAKDLISVTVVAKTLEEADLFATALFVSDVETRKKILEENPEVKALLVTKDLKQTLFNSFGELIHEN
jgi:FAD:protein FMN transferase